MSWIYYLSGVAVVESGLYVGRTDNPNVRLHGHMSALRNGSHPNPYIQAYYRLHGPGSIVTGALLVVPKNLRNDAERLMIHRLNTNRDLNPYGWNRSPGGDPPRQPAVPIALWNGTDRISAPSFYSFFIEYPELEPKAVVQLLEGSIYEWQGWRLCGN